MLAAPGDKGQVLLFTELLRDKDNTVRRDAAEALGGLGRAAKSAVPILTKTLQDVDEDVRKAATGALEKIQKK